MKKPLLLLTLWSTGLMAQPTFNSTDMFGVNETFQSWDVTNAGTIDIGATGANSVWNFPDLISGTESTNTYLNPAGNPGVSNFPGANLCQAVTSLGGNPGYTYLKTTSQAFSIDGVWSSQQGTETISQLNPDMDIYRFPFTFNSSFTQPVGGTTTTQIAGVNYTYIRQGTQTVTCDGYGTLTTPLGTFNNVLRLKTVQVYSDSIDFQGIPQVFNYESIIHNWVSVESKGVTLLSHTSFSVNGSATISGTLSTIPTVGIAEASNKLNFNLFPNPAKDLLMVQTPSLTNGNLVAEIFSITGQFIKKIELTNQQGSQFNFQLDGIESGAYLLRLSDKKSSGMQRFIVI